MSSKVGIVPLYVLCCLFLISDKNESYKTSEKGKNDKKSKVYTNTLCDVEASRSRRDPRSVMVVAKDDPSLLLFANKGFDATD